MHIFPAVECTDPKIPFSSRTKPTTGGTHHVRFIEKLIEEIETCQIVWRLKPHVRCIDTAINHNPERFKGLADDLGIGHIEMYKFSRLVLPVRTVDRFGAALDDILNFVVWRLYQMSCRLIRVPLLVVPITDLGTML